ncbi:MAG: hypothetical protein A2826_00665 [Candidatus Doudnabacteria bacterium RIFCSPHIGHO2_01_FULL_43_23]|uniref:Clp R domain-containing protein n=1 Tax=Candidatus Doudnabacteria bacterium RIFCSPHIGHO2_01_FULL_43_23 TaxID=1817822 RepID=A0A1F5NU46_9BACT|nr:MAG: hypothetical protein A2826_00665 [Candidatus Doudnabacteria bacterium RIFCSPHIGHO2_01_FULL_43_23]
MIPNILEKLSTRAKNSLIASQRLAESQKVPAGTEHLFYGVVKEASSFAASVILKNKVTAEQIREELLKGSFNNAGVLIDDGITLELKLALEKSAIVAQTHNYQFIGTEHFLFALAEGNSAASVLMKKLGLDPEQLKKSLKGIFENFSRLPEMISQDEDNDQMDFPEPPSRIKSTTLDYFATDLTKKATEGNIDPVIGREKEIERVISILNRRNKNNPVLIGEPGVGKTAIVEGLALAITQGEVPDFLLDKKILSLDLALVIAGSMFRGEFENRLKQIIDEIQDSENVILFIDELHTIVGAGATQGSLDAANILKPALARAELSVIGATTLSDYKKHFENDAALERRFQPVLIEEPTLEQTKKILEGLKNNYEKHHRLRITPEALHAAAEYATRYIPDRFLPDKAIDLLDESAAQMRTKLGRSKKFRNIKALEAEISKLEQEKATAVIEQNFDSAKALKYQQLKLQKSLESSKKRFESKTEKNLPELTEDHIIQTIASITKIPLQKLMQKELRQLSSLFQTLQKYIIGQDEALKTIAETVKRARTGVSSHARPIGSFLFLGPTGVGKTETAKVLAREIFGAESSLVKVDMSEFMEKHSVARLTGAPAGYVGFEEGGRLTEAIRRKPYSVVLFDEMEKAHPDVYNILLQILDEGRLTDASGRKIDFKNTIIILTSNIGTGEIYQEEIGFDEKSIPEINHQKSEQKILKTLKSHLRPELINRIDNTLVFRSLDKDSLKKIVQLELERLAKRLEENHINLNHDIKLINFLNKVSHDPREGARKIRRNIEKYLENAISEQILLGKIPKNSQIKFQVEEKNKKQPIKILVS